MSDLYVYIPAGEIVVYLHGGELTACEGELKKIIRSEHFVSRFPTRTVFAFNIDSGCSIQGKPVPPVVFFRLQGRGIIAKVGMVWRDIWEKQKKDFSLKFQEKIATLHRGNMFFSELEISGVLVAEANKIAEECEMPVVIFGVGRVPYEQRDPFDPPKKEESIKS